MPRNSPLANSGLHISHHHSGESHIRVQQFPIPCLGFGPKIKLPFSRREYIDDVIAKKQLFSDIDLTAEQKPGSILVLKSESMINSFLSSHFKDWLANPKYVDYYNLVKANPYRPTSDFRELFPYKSIEIDAQQIEQAISAYNGNNLYGLFKNLRKNKYIEDVDIVFVVPHDQSYFIMSGTCSGLRIDLDNIEDTIDKFPGARLLSETFRKLVGQS